ncbi:MAG: tetratricopeptide repeat protein [Acidobacteriaceae bacterium]|nr:tetratricopeptide repeat protein [Acidobacteriaceae bacterium]
MPVQLAAFWQGGHAVESLLADGLALMKSGDFQAAASEFQRAVQASPESAYAHYNLALALLRLDKNSEAADEFKKVTVLAPQIAPAHYNLALLLEQNGDSPHAIEQFQAFRALNPSDGAAIVHLVYNYFRAGAATEALSLAREALSQSSDLKLKAQLGVVLFENGHASDALEPLEAVIRSAPNALSVIPYLARAYVETGDPGKAKDLLRHALQLNPDDPGLHFSLGRLLLASSNLETQQEGTDEVNAAIHLSPRTSEYYEALGRSLLERNQLERAASVLKQGLERVPASVNLNLMLGVAEAELHGATAAKPYIEKALSLDPRAALGYNLAGNLYLRNGIYNDALKNYMQAAKFAPQNDLYLYDVALVLERMNKVAEAISYAEKAVSLKPDRGITHYILGKLYSKLERNADAVRELEACIRLEPSAEPAYYLLARTYRKLGDESKAGQCAAKLNELKAARDSRVGLAGPATASTTLLDTPAPWDNTR